MTAPLVAERAGTVVIPAPAGGRLTAGALAPYERDPAEHWSTEAVITAAMARVGRALVDRQLVALERKVRSLEVRARMGERRTAAQEQTFRRLTHQRRQLEALEAALARVARQYEDQQALRLVRL